MQRNSLTCGVNVKSPHKQLSFVRGRSDTLQAVGQTRALDLSFPSPVLRRLVGCYEPITVSDLVLLGPAERLLMLGSARLLLLLGPAGRLMQLGPAGWLSLLGPGRQLMLLGPAERLSLLVPAEWLRLKWRLRQIPL